MDDDEKISVVRTLSNLAMDAELSNTELEFFEFLTGFFETQAKKHHLAGYNQALRDLGIIHG